MEVLHCPDNLKVHFAGAENEAHYKALQILGVEYTLYTAFSWVNKYVFGQSKKFVPGATIVPTNLASGGLHCIQDSGLFTLMFGAKKDIPKDYKMLCRWYDGLVAFTLNHQQPVTCVECDCQRVLGVDAAWEFRQRMRNDLPNNRIINVFHLPDGKYGLDRLIEFSEYIAISVPELRLLGKKNLVPQLASYIKKKKPSIDIHLLGCTELSLMKQCRFCTSCDSTSWLSSVRYGHILGHHESKIQSDGIIELIGKEKHDEITQYLSLRNANAITLNIEKLKRDYQNAAGNQDYYAL